MSCCDNSTVKIVNNTGQAINILDTGSNAGTVLSIPGPIADGNSSSGTVSSASGSKGAANGGVQISIGNTGVTLDLNYAFNPKDSSGSCPCAAASQSAQSGGNYSATASTSSGSKKGEAVLTWTISSGFIGGT
jgi:hypothetical protein